MAWGAVSEHVYVDANIILRFLEGWPEHQAVAALRLFRRAERGEIVIELHPTVVAEVVYVLCSPRSLGLERRQVAAWLREFLSLPGLSVPGLPATLKALEIFESGALDWVDYLLLAHTPDATVYSFDEKMQKAGARPPS